MLIAHPYTDYKLGLIVIWYHWIAGGFAIHMIRLRSTFMFEFMNEMLTERDTLMIWICFQQRAIDISKLIFFYFRIYFHSEHSIAFGDRFLIEFEFLFELDSVQKDSWFNQFWVGSWEAAECKMNQFN